MKRTMISLVAALVLAICFGLSASDATDNLTQITFDGGWKVYTTDWSSDGKWITYTNGEDVYIISVDGGYLINLTEHIDGICFFPNFSNSKEVTFNNLNDPNLPGKYIMKMNIETLEYHILVEDALNGFWSHNGQYLAYSSGDSERLIIYDMINNTKSIIADANYNWGVTDFSPDDAYVITTLNGGSYGINEKLYKIPVEGGIPEQLTYHKGNHWYPNSSPDGQWILYTNFTENYWADYHNIYALNTRTGITQPVFPNLQYSHRNGSFSPDGTQFCFNMDVNGKVDVYVADFTPIISGILAVSAPDTATAGSTFVVEVKAQDVTDLFGVGFVLNWPWGAYIDYVNAEQGDFLGSDIIFYSSPEENANKVSFGISRKAGQSNMSGSGVLAKVTFISGSSTPNNTIVTFTLSNIIANKGDGSSIYLSPENGSTTITSGIPVWPGDTNNNGKVDQSDILPIGLYWAKTGTQRPNRSTSWVAQLCPEWSPVVATYADANGDGVVNQGDVLPIGLNWGKTHTSSKDVASKIHAGVTILLVPQAKVPIAAETEFYVDVNVKDVSGLFGIGFVLTYDNKDLIEPVSAEAGAFLGGDVIFFPQVDVQGDNIAVGISKKSGQSDVSGSGTIVRVKCKASKNIEKGSGITFTLTDITTNNSAGEAVDITPLVGYIEEEVGVDDATPIMFSLAQNHPNPFNPNTSISYTLGAPDLVHLAIYNVSGQLVRTVVDGYKTQGRHTAVWNGFDENGKKVSAGVYLYRLRAGTFVQTRKMVLMQ